MDHLYYINKKAAWARFTYSKDPAWGISNAHVTLTSYQSTTPTIPVRYEENTFAVFFKDV